GVLGHDLAPGRAYEEVSRTAHELQRIGGEIVDLQRKNQVAILYSDDSYYGMEFMKFSDRVNYRTIEQQMYRVLYRANIGIDFVFPDSTNLSSYNVIRAIRSEEHTSELQSPYDLVCRLLLEKKKKRKKKKYRT